MMDCLRAEWLKQKRGWTLRLCYIVPFLTAVIAFFLGGSASVQCSANWYFMFLLPLALALWASEVVGCDKRTRWQNVVLSGIGRGRVWLAKCTVAFLMMMLCNGVWLAFDLVLGAFTQSIVSSTNLILATFLASLTFAWQLPVLMALTERFHTLVAVVVGLGMNVILSAAWSEKAWYYLYPPAITQRVIEPFVGVHPNGVLLEVNSPFWDIAAIWPGIYVSLACLVVARVATTWWFERRKGR